MLVTTSRYASLLTKKYALGFSRDSRASYLNRGKKTLDEVALTARSGGHRGFAVVAESGGKPSQVRFAVVKADGSWEWAEKKQVVQ